MAASAAGCLLVQFAREPVAGAVKTRMIPHLSPEQALALHCELVLRTASTLARAELGTVELAVAGNAECELFRDCRGLGVDSVTGQRGHNLGERMYNAISDGLNRCERVMLVGSDCPGIDGDYLSRAHAALDHAEVVVGPATDGGYVLIGARIVSPQLFEGITWGTSSVLDETRLRLRRLGLSWAELQPLADIDRPEDLVVWEEVRGA